LGPCDGREANKSRKENRSKNTQGGKVLNIDEGGERIEKLYGGQRRKQQKKITEISDHLGETCKGKRKWGGGGL